MKEMQEKYGMKMITKIGLLVCLLFVLFAIGQVSAQVPNPWNPPIGYTCFEHSREYLEEWWYLKVYMHCTTNGAYGDPRRLIVITGISPEDNNGIDIGIFWYDATIYNMYIPIISRGD